MAQPPLADPGTLLSTIHEVDGRLRVRLRLARPSDALRLQAFFDGATDVRHFTFYDPRRRLVVVAAAMIGHGEEIVGVAEITLDDTLMARLGVVVDDERQGMGVGKLLSEAIASLAIHQGATHLRAELREGNERMVALMRRIGRTMVTVEDGGSVAVTRLPAARRQAA